MHSEKKMSLFDLVFMGIGGCIGAGIYSMLGVGIGLTGRSVAIAFLIAMLFKMSQQTRMIVTSSMFSNCQAKCNSLVEKVNRRNKVKTFSGAIVNQIKNSVKALS